MTYLAWNNKYLVGMEVLDYQHQQIFEMVNTVYASLISGAEPGTTADLVQRLMDTTREHFATEEAILSAAGYPGLGAHRALHAELIRRVQSYCSRSKCGENLLSPHLVNFLRDWWVHHLECIDREYALWLQKVVCGEERSPEGWVAARRSKNSSTVQHALS